MSDLRAELFCDPFAPGVWRFRPLLSRIGYTFSELPWTVRPVAAVETRLEGEAADSFRTAATQAGAAADLPVAAELFAEGVPSSWPACEALVAVRSSQPEAARRYLDRLSARTFAEGEPPTSADTLAALAESVGVAGDVVRDAVGSRRATAAVGRDIERGRALFETLHAHEVRGDPEADELGARLSDDGGAADPADGGDDSAEHDDADAPSAPAAQRSLAGSASAVPRPPLVRIYAGDRTVVVDPRTGFDEFLDVLHRYDPDLGDLDWESQLYGRKVMTAYSIPDRTAEHLSTEPYGEKIRTILTALGEAFTAEVAACADLDAETVRLELRSQRADGVVESTDSGAWTLSNQTD
jgi:hypothetical protein